MHNDRPVITIIYGIPSVGKSSVAIKYAAKKRIKTVISTDYLREIQRLYSTKEKSPFLFTVSHKACDLLETIDIPLVVEGFQKHVDAVYPAIEAVIKKLSIDGYDAIVEGVHFDSRVFRKLASLDVIINPLLLAIESKGELEKRISFKLKDRRGGEDKKWKDNIDRIMKIQEYLVRDAKDTHIETHTNMTIDETISKLKQLYG